MQEANQVWRLKNYKQGHPMIDLIIRDSILRPDLFFWRAGVPLSEIGKWERKQFVSVPDDLKELWSTKGGGDLFETEMILQPSGADEDDLMISSCPGQSGFGEKALILTVTFFTKACIFRFFGGRTICYAPWMIRLSARLQRFKRSMTGTYR